MNLLNVLDSKLLENTQNLRQHEKEGEKQPDERGGED